MVKKTEKKKAQRLSGRSSKGMFTSPLQDVGTERPPIPALVNSPETSNSVSGK